MEGMHAFVVSFGEALARRLSLEQISSLNPAKNQHGNHEKTGDEGHENACGAPILMPRVEGTIFDFSENVVNKLQLEVEERYDDDAQQIQTLRRNEQVEVDVVAATDTIIHPRTVMVKSVDTPLTKRTMATSWRAYDFTIRTQTTRFESIQKCHKIHALILLKVARI